jgi:hypothetical protein
MKRVDNMVTTPRTTIAWRLDANVAPWTLHARELSVRQADRSVPLERPLYWHIARRHPNTDPAFLAYLEGMRQARVAWEAEELVRRKTETLKRLKRARGRR